MKSKKIRHPGRGVKWNDSFYVDAYEMAKQGATNAEISRLLGVTEKTFGVWCDKRAALRKALDKARSGNQTATVEFKEYILGQLPVHLQELWAQLMVCDEEQSGPERVEAILHGQTRNRQQLFLHALIAYNFNISRALKVVNISRGVLKRWGESDPKFQEMLEEMDWHKGNFFENALLQGVARGESNLVKFVNETYNKDRGYGKSVDMNLSGDVDHNHNHTIVNIDTLGLSLELKKQLLTALRAPQEPPLVVEAKLLPPSNGNGKPRHNGKGPS